MGQTDIERLVDFVASLRDSAQNMADACSVFLSYLTSSLVGEEPQSPDVYDQLEWEQRTSEKGFQYEMLRIDEDDDLQRHLRLILKQNKGRVTIGGYRYSLGRDEKVIFRNKLKKQEEKRR